MPPPALSRGTRRRRPGWAAITAPLLPSLALLLLLLLAQAAAAFKLPPLGSQRERPTPPPEPERTRTSNAFPSPSTNHHSRPPPPFTDHLLTHTHTYITLPAKVLVAGATGRVGRLVVQRLLERGYSVVALARDPDKAREAFGRRAKDGPLTVATADVTDAASLVGPMRGCVACVSCVCVWFVLVCNVRSSTKPLGLTWPADHMRPPPPHTTTNPQRPEPHHAAD